MNVVNISNENGNISITNEDTSYESFSLEESICSDQTLRFGCCEASKLNLQIRINTPLKGEKINVCIIEETKETKLGFFSIVSDEPTADKCYRNIKAYDRMYDILTWDATTWYNTILPNNDSTVTLKQFRYSFFQHLGIEQEEVELVNDSMTVTKTIEPSQLSGKTVITAICEINGCFGHIGRNGKFQYIFLKEMIPGLYPSNTLYPRDDLYPADPMNATQISRNHYISAEYEDFETKRINKLLIRKEENDIGANYPEGNVTESDNCYIVQDNFLVYGKSTEELTEIAKKMYSVICRVWYRPAHVEAKGNPCMEVGDGIKLSTKNAIVYTYILKRTLKGIQALKDTYDAEGKQYQAEKVNSVREEIIQLKGKANKLTRTIEETKSEITDIEKGLSTKIQQNAEGISLEARRALEAEGLLSASIHVNAESIVSEVARAKKEEVALSSRITQTAESITAEVKRATEAEGNLSAQASINAQQILLKVNKDGVVSAINQTAETIKIQATKIDLVGLVNADELVSKFATIESLNVTNELVAKKATIDQLNATNAVVSGKLNASEFTADNISAMSITVKAANVTGGFNASKITAGTISVERLDIDGILSGIASKSVQCVTMTGQTVRASSYKIYDGSAYVSMSAIPITINGKSYRLLGYTT